MQEDDSTRARQVAGFDEASDDQLSDEAKARIAQDTQLDLTAENDSDGVAES